MALTIMNNPTAIGAMGKLNNTNSALSKTISQLSSGLRINSAADDASGLAVSEKLRGQISGLSKASSNAQDAISLLQTAEGAMGSMTDILQRMRELAVQAGDPAYTTNDRAMLQSEVDQLKEEVNRISTSAEFNTKKLLNGDAAGVWSSSSNQLEAILRGSPAEGNYKIETDFTEGSAYAYNTGIMNVKDGVMTVNDGKALADASKIEALNARGVLNGSNALSLTSGSAVITSAFVSLGQNGAWTGSDLSAAVTNMSATGSGGYLEIKALKDFVTGADTTDAIMLIYTDALTGEKITKTVGLSADGTLTGAITMTANSTSGLTVNIADVTIGRSIKKGDSMAFARTKDTVATTANTASVNIGYGYGTANATLTVRADGAIKADKNNTVTLYTGAWDKDLNQMTYGELDVTFKQGAVLGTATETYSGTAALTIKSGGIANSMTKLSDLNNFINADGRNVLANTQKLSIYANGKSVDISIEGSDTVKDLLERLNGAFEELGLGKDIAKFITSPEAMGDEAVQGTFMIDAKDLKGDASKISFVGDQNVLNGLSVNTIREGTNNTTKVTITDAHDSNKAPSTLGKDLTVTDGIVRGVIQGVDLKVTMTSSDTSYLHIQANPTKAAIGANEGQTLDISIGRMDTLALEIDDVVVATFDDAQKSITKIDRAMETLSKARSVTGAQMNRLNYTINNLTTMKENLTSAESSLRDLDMAQASTNLTAQQVRLQAATAMLAQANQMPSYAAQLLK